MSEEEVFEPYYDPARREAMRQTMVNEGFLSNLPLQALSDTERMQIDNRLMMEDQAVSYGGIDNMLDSFEEELAKKGIQRLNGKGDQ